MKSIKLISLIAILLGSWSLYGQNQIITMKDGTVYEGFISFQDYKTGAGRITYSRMTKTVPVGDIQTRSSERKPLISLSEQWQRWAEENNKVEYEGKDKKYLTISRISIKGQPVREYYILVSGTKYYTLFTISEGTDECMLDNVVSICKPERVNTLLTDVDDVIQTDGATYTGVILEQVNGKTFTIWNKSDRSVHNIDYAEVRSIGKSRFNENYSLWKQTPYLDRVTLTNKVTGKGLIIENGFGEDINILFAEKSGEGMEVRQFNYDDILAVEKFLNPDYLALYDIVLAEGESRINRDSVLVFSDIKKLTKRDSTKVFYIDPEKLGSIAKVNDKSVVIETNLADISDIYIAKAMDLINVPKKVLSPAKEVPQDVDRRKNRRRPKDIEIVETVDLLTFTYESLFLSNVDYSSETSINGTTKISFDLPEPGTWFVYLRKIDKCWTIQLQ